MFDIFEPDTRGSAVSTETTSTVSGFVAIEAASSSAIPAQAPSTTSTSTQTEEAVATASPAVSKSNDLYAEDIYIGSLAEFTTDDGINAAGNESTDASQETAHIPQEATEASQELIAAAKDATPVDQQTPESAHVSTSSASESLTVSSSPSDALSDAQVKQLLEKIPFSDYYPECNFLQLRDSIKSYEHCIEKAKKANNGTFHSVTELDWKIRAKKTYISLVMREQEDKKWAEKNRHRPARPYEVVRAKNATDPGICNGLQYSPAVSDPNAGLQAAVEGWRDTVDGRAEEYRDTTDGTHTWKHMECEDSDGIDNNEYHDYFPDVPRKAVYHSTAMQTRVITSPLLYEQSFGKKPTNVELRKIMRSIGSVDYVDQAEVRYGKPFLAPSGPYLDTHIKTQDSGFQTMDFEVREANIIKARLKAGITAAKLNKLSIERDNGIRVFAERSKDRVVHSQQLNALRAIVDRAGTVESYGSFTPMIYNIVYEETHSKPVTITAQAHSTSLICTPSNNLPQPVTLHMEVMEPKKIPSYCSSPSLGLYEDVQSNRPELFENGWPMNQFPPKETDGTYSHDVFKDFGLPNSKHRHQTIRKITRTTIHPDAKVRRNSASKSTQQTHDGRIASDSHMPPISLRTPHTPAPQQGQGMTRKRSMGQVSDEGYKSHSPSESSNKRHKIEKSTTASTSHFSTPYHTPLPSNGVKVSTSISNCPDTATPKTDDKSALLTQSSSKRKRDASPAQELSENIEKSTYKRLRLQPTPTPIRRLPPTELTLKVINPKGNIKAGVLANHKNSRPTVPQASCGAPRLNANATLLEIQPQEPVRKQVQQPILAAPAPAPAPALCRPAWADRKPTANRDNKKENPNRWRINLGAVGRGRRHDPYNASGRPGRRN
ncbi:hypothetical protein PMIN01_12314 [Paraphaeosphaeria minitans]|uniref:Uncharacterized protein n=1 Tax=Paraphaeosphaeria minitans TaxID=565426 RepID=A0A9P6G6P9_9PLEO|nr:hypothetical protein PMIN01_12314 [Paraphaeosphaeria minitans]